MSNQKNNQRAKDNKDRIIIKPFTLTVIILNGYWEFPGEDSRAGGNGRGYIVFGRVVIYDNDADCRWSVFRLKGDALRRNRETGSPTCKSDQSFEFTMQALTLEKCLCEPL